VNFFVPLTVLFIRVHLIRKETIENYVVKNAGGKKSFATWLTAIRYADWNGPADIKSTFGSADLLGQNSNRVVFNIGGNNYRMICKYAFGRKQVHLFICWIGTHAEYDRLCDNNEQYTVTSY
jgi:mRNA interferase HigB